MRRHLNCAGTARGALRGANPEDRALHAGGVNMSLSVRRILTQAVVISAMCCTYIGAAMADADARGAPGTPSSGPKQDEQAQSPMRTIALGHGSRDRLAHFFERTKGATRLISASEVWASLDAGTMKYQVVDVRTAEEFAN